MQALVQDSPGWDSKDSTILGIGSNGKSIDRQVCHISVKNAVSCIKGHCISGLHIIRKILFTLDNQAKLGGE
jgi:hypothetical protein